MATPNDLDTNWNAWTLVVRPCELGEDGTDGAELEEGTEECADRLESGGEVVHDPVNNAATTKPARRIFDGTGELLSACRL